MKPAISVIRLSFREAAVIDALVYRAEHRKEQKAE